MPITWSPCPPDRDPGVYAGGRRVLIGGQVRVWSGAALPLLSPIHEERDGTLQPRTLGASAQLDTDAALDALRAAASAWNRGRGEWPTMSVKARLECMADFLKRMEARRIEVARLITWEIGKPWADALAEFDRTIAYGRATIEAVKELDRDSTRFAVDGGFFAQVRRAPFGVVLCLGPYNYPLNETYTTLLPALVMGNTLIMKPPRMGVFCHLPMLDDFAAAFPPGAVNVITGDGAATVGPIMATGEVDVLAFIGSARVANLLKKSHPAPSRLRGVLGLGAKNPAIVLEDADLDLAVKECVDGTLTFNGQRCTALKMLFVHRAVVDRFLARFVEVVDTLKCAMPFEDGAVVTPLPDLDTVQKMVSLRDDALSHGARIVNANGGAVDRTYFHPAVMYPAVPASAIWRREQFGPIVPVAAFDDVEEVIEYVVTSSHGQQLSIFGNDPSAVGRLIDPLANQVCRINVNTQCRRGPDTFPFGGRKESAEGTLSVTDALRVFSIRSLVAAKQTEANTELTRQIILGRHSQFLNTDYLF